MCINVSYRDAPANLAKCFGIHGFRQQRVVGRNSLYTHGIGNHKGANSLEIKLPLLFGSSDPDENYLSFIVK